MTKLRQTLSILRGFFPKRLPIGAKAFGEFCESLFSTYGIPNLPSYKSAVATRIMHLDHTKCYVTPFHFYLILRKAQANEIAFAYLDEQRREEGKRLREEKQATEDARIAALAKSVTKLNDSGVVSEAQA